MTRRTDPVSASGITYDNAQDLVETIVSMKKGKYNFPGVDPEDLAQDIRVMCWEALEQKFDPDRVNKSVFHFVARVVDNGLYNKFRGVYLDNNPPCLRCDDYVKATKECRIDEVGCDRIVSYRERMARKRAIAAPLSYNAQLDSDEGNDFTHHDSLSVGSTTDAFAHGVEHHEVGQLPEVTLCWHVDRSMHASVRTVLENQAVYLNNLRS